MPPIFNPSIWDYIAQAGSQGISSYQDTVARKKAEDERKRQEALQGLQFTMGLEQQGMVPFGQVNQQIQQNQQMLPYLKGVQMQGPSAGGLQAQIANTPDRQVPVPTPNAGGGFNVTPIQQSGVDQFTDSQRRRAGLPTRADLEAQTLGLTKTKQDIKTGGFNLGRAETQAKEEDAMMPVRRLKELKPVLDDAAEAFVSKEFNKAGGKLNPKDLDAMAERAYANFLSTKGNTELLQMSPDQGVLARSYFDKAVRGAFERQQEIDLRKQIAAIQAGGRNGSSPAALANALSTAASKFETQAKNLEAALPAGTRAMTGYSPENLTPEQKARVAEIDAVRGKADMFMRANAGLTSGLVSPEMAQQMLLNYMQDSGSLPGNVTTAPSGPGAPQVPAMEGGKRKITADQREFLKARGQWDPSKYEVIP